MSQNVSRCKKCQQEIIWIPKPDGGWYPPMERLDAGLSDEAYQHLHSLPVFQVQDGLQQVRIASFVRRHVCPEEAPVETPAPKPRVEIPGAAYPQEHGGQPNPSWAEVDEIVRSSVASALKEERQREEKLERERALQQERAAAHDRKQDERERQRIESATERQEPFLSVLCPFCKVGPGELCLNMSAKKSTDPRKVTMDAHRERQDFFYGTTGDLRVEVWESSKGPFDVYPDMQPFDPQKDLRGSARWDAYAWFRTVGAGLWSELRTRDSDGDLNPFGIETETTTEAGTGTEQED